MKKLAIFDVDGTITESKSDITREMATAVVGLLQKMDVAFISGCTFKQMKTQVWKGLQDGIHFRCPSGTMYLLPTSGAAMYEDRIGLIEKVYDNSLTLSEKVFIYNAWEGAVAIARGWAEREYGQVAEDRGGQVTFSMCGQDAPLEVKKKYDPDFIIRGRIAELMKPQLPGFEVRLGGTTSIDVTRKGIDKEYGVNRLLELTSHTVEGSIFFGDALFEGGNDAAVKKTGVECVEVSSPEDTIQKIASLVSMV